MIVTRTPFRIPLGGGGTDLPAYYRQHGGFLVTAAIDKYVYITVNKRFEPSLRVSYSKTEIVDRPDELQHPIVREALKLLGLDSHLEIVSIADLPANTGMGSSSSFTVGLLNALHAYKREHLAPQALAEEAFHVEVDLVGEPIGKQDQYAAAFGGIVVLDIDCEGRVTATPLHLHEHTVEAFEGAVSLYYTGIQRAARDVLGEQSARAAVSDAEVTDAMHGIKRIGGRVADALRAGDLDRFGELLHEHWETKKRVSTKMTNPELDGWYELARRHGAAGGKVMGAGGGGFFMFCTPNGHKPDVRAALGREGLRELRYSIDFEGSKVIVNF
jgi:D-glycero-alpha-D-manno-heptose-7-phosphate kinase